MVTWPCDERTAAWHHNILLAEDVLLLQRIDDVLLLEALKGERLRSFVNVLDQFNPTETADAQRCHHIQITQPDVAELWNAIENIKCYSLDWHGTNWLRLLLTIDGRAQWIGTTNRKELQLPMILFGGQLIGLKLPANSQERKDLQY